MGNTGGRGYPDQRIAHRSLRRLPESVALIITAALLPQRFRD